MPLIKVGTVAALPPDSVMEVVADGQPYAICNVGGTVTALSGICIHRGGPLGQGQIENGHVICPFHMWAFDCRTGAYDYDPSQAVATFEVKVEEGEIFLRTP
jgi:nitrite reductase/ring-hydroxylating ferredoxin subunit